MLDSNDFLNLNDLQSAEDFLDYFSVNYQPSIVHINRLHILQRFHNYMAKQAMLATNEASAYKLYKELLTKAYEDFVNSDAQTEKVFKVFKLHETQQAFVPLSDLKL